MSIKKILIGYEYGSGMGHLSRMLPVGRVLSDRNYQIIFFLHNPIECAKIIAKEKLSILPVMWMATRIPEMGTPPRFHSYSDIMAAAGAYNVEQLFTLTLSWKTIFDIYKPDLIVCDHSPNCCLAAFNRIPVVLIGDGFTLPPVHESIFPVTRGATPVFAPDQLLENMRIVQKMHGRRIPQTITEPFRTAARLFCTLSELDHYPLMRRDTVIGPPLSDLLEPAEPPTEPRWFAYLKLGFLATNKILESLCDVKFPGEVYINGLLPEFEARLAHNNIVVHRDPPPMSQILPRVSVILHHGGNGVACAALSAGRPQLLVPMYQETELTGERLRRMGVGRILTPTDVQSGNMVNLLSAIAESQTMMERAQTVARNIHARGPSRFLETCIETCEKILAGNTASQTATYN